MLAVCSAKSKSGNGSLDDVMRSPIRQRSMSVAME
jgi:hypothetical protein